MLPQPAGVGVARGNFRMKSRLFFLLFSLSFLIACGGGNNNSSGGTSTSGNVSVTPATASVPINTTAQFNATVSNSTQGVYWSVNDTVGGNLTVGMISASGLYTAPAVIPSPATVTIKATSVADSTQTSTSKVTVTSGTALTIGITPTTASVYTGRTQQFAATFNSTNNTQVAWQVNSITGGDSTHGTINASGLYTAPATVPSPNTVTITAISEADTTKTATATVTIVPGSVINISPASAIVPASGTQAFSATVNNQPVTVTWTLNCNSSQAGACGTISSAGLYTAPAFPPPGGTIAITATGTDNSALPAGATVSVQISNGSLNGRYAFAMSGTASGAPYAEAGTIVFDGSGTVSSGSADFNNNGVATQPLITTGSYHISTDGSGIASLSTTSGTQTWQIVLKDNTKAFLVRTDSGTTGSGVLYLQDASQFATSKINGNYGLELAPPSSQTGTAAYAGVMTADGAGTISGGKLDISNGGTVNTAVSVSGSYGAPDATTGRGTLSLTSSGTQNLAYYVVNGARALLVDLDAGKIVHGELVQQGGAPFSVASLAGNYSMTAIGWNTQGALAIGGVFTLDGAGAVTSGVADTNSNGNTQAQSAVTGTYAVTDATTGRTEATLTIGGSSRKFVLYPQASGVAEILEIDGAQTTSGRAYLQASNADSASSFSGTYSTLLSGVDLLHAGEVDATGFLTPNGGSAISGLLDANDAGTVTANASLQGSYGASTPATRKSGTWTTNLPALGNASGQFVYYVVSPTRVLVLELDSNRVLTGTMEKPY
jgi:hypothetical protein